MNLLTSSPPETVEIDGQAVRIKTDFRHSLRTIMAMEDNDLTPHEKVSILLRNAYEEIPANPEQAIEKAHWFLNCGKVNEEQKDAPRVYSFSQDAQMIFSAFWQTHAIDLTKAELHWWTFVALFMDLGQDTAFSQLVSLRQRVKTGKATKDERRAANEMGEIFHLEDIDTRTLDEKIKARTFEEMIEKGRANRERMRRENDAIPTG
jgi:hypothetical protein